MAQDDGRTRLAYHLPNTWGMKHNLIWDRVLGLDLFPASLGDAEIAWYLEGAEQVRPAGGQPHGHEPDRLGHVEHRSGPQHEDFEALVAPMFRYANETPTRVPLSDWFKTTDATRAGFQARPVVGGIFIRLLAEPSAWSSLAKRGRARDG